MKNHHYKTQLKWTGNTGNSTQNYTSYERSYTISAENKPDILGSSDPAFRGDTTKYNPEEMLVTAVSSCHMLWYLHFCAAEGILVEEYSDQAEGTMKEENNGSGAFTEINLYPTVVIRDGNRIEKAQQLHQKAHEYCFIANSLNFPVKCIPEITIKNIKNEI